MRKLALPLMASCALFGVTAAPTLATDTNVKQNNQIAKITGAIKGVKKSLKRLRNTDKGQNASVDKVAADLANTNNTIGVVVKTATDALTQLKDGLTQLKAGLETAGAGLTALKAGLETAGAGLTQLGDAYKAVEYGITGITATGATPTIAAGGSAMSADVPDDGNTVHVGDTAIVVAGSSAAMAINLLADIRSNEGDNAADETVGQAGGFLWVQNLDTGARVACIGAPDPPGIFGTIAGDSIVTPSGTVTNLPIKNLPGGRERTDTTAPSTSILPAACNFVAAAGTTYGVTYSVNFLDVPTSTSPGGTE